jgi:outer membrane receptor protein involved in Fe transport
MRRVLPRVLALFFLLAAATPLVAQTTTGDVLGTVSDESQAPLPGATVTIRGEKIAGSRSAQTNERGAYHFAALPPGSYDLSFSLAGFTTLNRQAIRVSLGGTTEEDVSLKVGQHAEEITVVGGASVVDSQSNEVSTLFDRDWVKNAPIARNSFIDLINAAPGVGSAGPTAGKSDNSTVFGSSTTDNTYMMDGTDLTAPYDGEVWPLPNTDAVEEIQVLGLGAPAEYGNLQGAVFNVVTRQGTNAFHGDANFYFQSQSLTSRNTNADQDGGFPYHRSKYNDLTFQLDGPIVKDKLWFFVAYEYKNDRDSQPGTDPALPITDQRQSGIAKLNWQISDKQKLMVAFHEDYYHLPFAVTATNPPNTVNVDHGTSPAPNLTYTVVLSDKTYIEARVAGFYGSDHGDPVDGSPRIARRFLNVDTGQTTGGIFDWYDGSVDRTGANVKVSHFADRFLGGSHDFKFGIQYSQGGADYITGYNDYIYSYAGYTYGYTQKPYHNAGQERSIAGFADDTYRLGSRLTLNLGLRYDNNRASFSPRDILDASGNPTGQQSPAVSDLFTWSVFSPRIGFTLKLTPDGKSLLKGHYGRYYRGIITSEFDSVSPSIPPKYLFSGAYDQQGNPLGLSVFNSNANLRIDPNYKDPKTDQYIASFEQEVAKNLALTLTYVHKSGSDFAGWTDLTGQYVPVPFVDNVGPEATGQTLTLQQLVSDPSQRVFELTNPPGLFSTYNGGVFGVTKRMADHWQANASLVVSKSEGRIASSILGASDDQSSTAGQFNSKFFGRNPNDYLNTSGLLLADRPVVAKVQFLYELPVGFLLGINYSFQKGRPWTPKLDVSNVVSIPGTFINERPLDGSLRLPDLSLLDARLQKSFSFGKARLNLLVDGLNLLNADASEGVLSQVATSTTFGLPDQFVLPRRLMLGAKIEF